MFKKLFGEKDTRTPQEKFDDLKKTVRSNSRMVDREIRTLERELKKLDDDIKKSAKNNPNMNVLKIKAKTRLRTQKSIERLYTVKGQIESTLTQITLQKANIMQGKALQLATDGLKQLNAQTNTQEMQRVNMDFTREVERNELMSELINDTLDQDEDTEEVDDTIFEALAEAGVQNANELKMAWTSKEHQGQQVADSSASLPALPDIPM